MSSMSQDDLWDESTQGPDPFADEVATEAPAESLPAEETPVEEEGPAQPSEAVSGTATDTDGDKGDDEGAPAVEASTDDAEPPAPTEEDWKRRYEGLRNSRENTAAELAREREARLQVEQAARQLLEMEQQRLAQSQTAAPPAPQPDLPQRTDAELVQMGFESRDAYNAVLADARKVVEAQMGPQFQQLSASQQQIAQQMAQERQRQQQAEQQSQTLAERQAVQQAVLSFGEKHAEFVGDSLEAQGLRDDFDRTIEMWNSSWARKDGAVFDPADPPSLEVAAEATRWPALGDVLAESPNLFESERGLQLARIQARLLDSERGTPTKTPKVDSQAVDKRLKAANTLPGTSGSPSAPKTPADKEWDDVENEWQTASKGSIFT